MPPASGKGPRLELLLRTDPPEGLLDLRQDARRWLRAPGGLPRRRRYLVSLRRVRPWSDALLGAAGLPCPLRTLPHSIERHLWGDLRRLRRAMGSGIPARTAEDCHLEIASLLGGEGPRVVLLFGTFSTPVVPAVTEHGPAAILCAEFYARPRGLRRVPPLNLRLEILRALALCARWRVAGTASPVHFYRGSARAFHDWHESLPLPERIAEEGLAAHAALTCSPVPKPHTWLRVPGDAIPWLEENWSGLLELARTAPPESALHRRALDGDPSADPPWSLENPPPRWGRLAGLWDARATVGSCSDWGRVFSLPAREMAAGGTR